MVILRCVQCCLDSDFKTLSPPRITAKLCVGSSSTRVSLHFVQKGFLLLLLNGMLFGFHDERGLGWQKGLLPRQRAGFSG